MPRYLVDVIATRISRYVVVARNYEDAKDAALRGFNIRASKLVDDDVIAKVVKVLPERKFNEDEYCGL